MQIELPKSKDCCGCGACYNTCGLHAISMIPDKEGFLYPTINQTICVGCKSCLNACPIINCVHNDKDYNEMIAAYSNDHEIRYCSSSGGVFTELSECILDNNGTVFGVTMDKDCLYAHFMEINETKDLWQIRGSKYIQAEPELVYQKVKQKLSEGGVVLFAGTPCQVAALKTFLGIEYDTLYLIDFICHGVPSRLAWEKYILYLQDKTKSKAYSVSFRDKTDGWSEYSLRIRFNNGVTYKANKKTDPFLLGFNKDLFIRPSCSFCRFKGYNRCSDITIGDMWGTEATTEDLEAGISLMVIHTDKGKKLNDLIRHRICFENIQYNIFEKNISYYKSAKVSYYRDKFFNNINAKNYKSLLVSCCGINWIRRIKRILFRNQ